MDVFNEATSIKIPAKPEFVGVARLITAAFAGFLGFDSETVEDIKIAVSEACTSAIIQVHKDARDESKAGAKMVELVAYEADSELIIDVKYAVKDAAAIKTHAQTADRDLGMDLLTSIMDKVELIKEKDHEIVLRLSKHIEY